MNNAFLNKILKPTVLVPVLTGIGTFAGGLAVGYILGKKERKIVFIPNDAELAKIQHDVDEMRANREVRNRERLNEELVNGKASKPEVTVEEHIRRKLAHVGEGTGTEQDPAVVAHNVFAEQNWGDWDYEAEMRNRDSSQPYIIHEDEFKSNDLGYEQVSYLYYGGDDTLADVDYAAQYNRHLTIGDNLKFGYGSRDPKVVFIRNEQLRTEYEVTFDPGAHAVEVMGLEAEESNIQHSAPRRIKPLQE